MTMPAEINRLCTDAISDMLFTTDAGASDNLRREGVAEERIHFVGNTMIDTLLRHIDQARQSPPPKGLRPQHFAVLTLHRPGNVDNAATLTELLHAIAAISARVPVVFPVHPRTMHSICSFGLEEWLRKQSGIRIVEPLSYLPFLSLVAQSMMVLTDSGGIQEETTVLGVPCLTMRPNTERPVTCEIGTNVLVGTDPARITSTAFAVLSGGARIGSIPPKWDGHAAERILDVVVRQPVNQPVAPLLAFA
jgi:UDP-N-acetylglucosamine 2-epimerase (non-hydrolysing)